jgi:hypothetical protein
MNAKRDLGLAPMQKYLPTLLYTMGTFMSITIHDRAIVK